jgi:hypothetical protein
MADVRNAVFKTAGRGASRVFYLYLADIYALADRWQATSSPVIGTLL